MRIGEPGKTNLTPTNVDVSNVDIDGAVIASYDNRSQATLDVELTSGDDTVTTNAAATGSIHYQGLGGEDHITGGNTAGDTIEGGADDDTLIGQGGNDTLQGDGGIDNLDGGAGNDSAVYTGDYDDYTIVWNGTTATVTDNNAGDGHEGTDTVNGVGKLEFSGGKTVWLVGASSEYTTLTQLFDGIGANGEVDANDTVFLAAGTYASNISTALQGIEIRGVGNGTNPLTHTIITGTGGSAINFNNGAGDFTVRDLRMTGNGTGNGLQSSAANFAGLTIDNVTFHDFSIGVRKFSGGNISDVTIENATFSENNYGIYFAVDGNVGVTANNVNLTSVVFTNNLHAAMFAETLQNATFTDIDATVGNGTGNANGVVFDFWTNYAGATFSNIAFDDVDIDHTGALANNFSAAIRVVAFDGNGGITPTDISFNDVTISNALRALRTNADELELTFTNVTLTTVTTALRYEGITGVDNFDASALPVLGSGDYILVGDWSNHIGSSVLGGNDTLIGGAGGDQIFGNVGDDTLRGSGGADQLDGGAGIDTAAYTNGVDLGDITFNGTNWTVATGTAEGTDTLNDIEVIDGSTFRLVGGGGYDTIQAAINDADEGDTILVGTGTYNENLTVTKGLIFVAMGGEVTVNSAAANTPVVTISGDHDDASTSFTGFNFSGATGTGIGQAAGVYVTATDVDTLTFDDVSFTGNGGYGIFTNGADIDQLNITDSDFSNNATNGINSGAHIKLFGFTGSALLQTLELDGAPDATAQASRPDFGIEFHGVENAVWTGTPGLTPSMGTVVIDGVTISGEFHKSPFAINNYVNIDGLSITDLDLSDAEAYWGAGEHRVLPVQHGWDLGRHRPRGLRHHVQRQLAVRGEPARRAFVAGRGRPDHQRRGGQRLPRWPQRGRHPQRPCG